MSESTYRILMVCTGNICRSPVMERLLIARLQASLAEVDAARFQVESCGTWGLVGEPMAPGAAETLVHLGGTADGFIGRALEQSMLEAVDLVLTATREHRGIVVTEMPRAASRTLTLKEFARLLGPVTPAQITAEAGDDPVARWRAITARAFGNRGLVPIGQPSDDDVADPYGRPRESYVRAAAEIDAALDVALALLLSR